MQQKALLIVAALIGTLLVIIGFFFLRPELQEQILPPAQHPAQQAIHQEPSDTPLPDGDNQHIDRDSENDVTRIIIHHKNGRTDEELDEILSEKVIINNQVVDSPEPED
ncbi:hypothetical protein CI610_01576 [invertebrate metagenome]|uniref:Uncharacterized protein n=1 Tax=invertebrate metagenome TaxID=1711999 RepID=A0A2H9T882_9ZZZZ